MAKTASARTTVVYCSLLVLLHLPVPLYYTHIQYTQPLRYPNQTTLTIFILVIFFFLQLQPLYSLLLVPHYLHPSSVVVCRSTLFLHFCSLLYFSVPVLSPTVMIFNSKLHPKYFMKITQQELSRINPLFLLAVSFRERKILKLCDSFKLRRVYKF